VSADFDHTSFAVRNATEWAKELRRGLGAVPITGETLDEFRYLLLYVGTDEHGARIELMEPVADGFLSRFLARSGGGAHHITFSVVDLRTVVCAVRSLGLRVVGENYEHLSWQEAFIVPDSLHGTVIQLFSSDRAYPSATELLTSQHRTPELYPAIAGAADRSWWRSVWRTSVERVVPLGATHLGSSDLATSRRLFEGVLGASGTSSSGGLRFAWPNGSLQVTCADPPGVLGLELQGSAVPTLNIGAVPLTASGH
jgi:hypothetical protein